MTDLAVGEPPHSDNELEASSSLRETANLERYLARDPAFQGIGVRRAQDLAERFGTGLHAALAGQDEAVAEVVGEERAAALFVAYRLKLAEADIVAWLDDQGIEPTVGSKIVRCWGEMGAVRLKQNPFLLIGFIGWRAAEHVAERLRVLPDDPRRLVAAVEAVLYSRLDNGHTWTSRPNLEHGVRKLLGSPQLAHKAPDVAVDDMGAIPFGSGYQPAGASAMEQFCAQKLHHAIKDPLQYDLVAREITPGEINASLQAVEARQGFYLTDRQGGAVHMVLTARVGLLGGYAGSGKTSVLRAICDVAEAHGRVMHLMALSGKAARRISEATGRAAGTIASFLKRTEERAVSLGPETIIVVDEASMVDLTNLYRLLRRIGSGRLLLVGDPAQLPPIGFGNPFHALIDHPSLPSVVLDRVLRQTAESGIPAVAAAIRKGSMPNPESFTGFGNGVSFIDCDIEQAIDVMLKVGRTLSSEGAERGSIQIISPIRAGAAGINAINNHFHQIRAPGRDRFPGRDIAEGDPVIWLTNDYERDLQNGSTGRFLGLDKEYRPKVELDSRTFTMTAGDGANLDLAYSISVHKSQGSQWSRVIVPMFPSRILDRTLAYTAITRAAEQVILLGDRTAFQRAVKAIAAVDRRETCLSARLDKLLGDNEVEPAPPLTSDRIL